MHSLVKVLIANYYSKFIQKFSDKILLLNNNKEFLLTMPVLHSFEVLKNNLENVTLITVDPDEEFEVETTINVQDIAPPKSPNEEDTSNKDLSTSTGNPKELPIFEVEEPNALPEEEIDISQKANTTNLNFKNPHEDHLG